MQNDASEMGLKKLLNYLDDPDRNQAELEAGLAYLRQSPGYEERIEKFVQDVIAPAPESAPLAALPEKAVKILVGWQKKTGEKIDTLIIELTHNFGPPRQLRPRMSMLKGAKSMLWEVSIQEATEKTNLRLEVQEKREAPTHCTIMVDVQIPGRGPSDQADTAVILKRQEEEVTTQMTDRFGKVFFQDIAVDELTKLTLEITPSGQRKQ